MENTDRPERRPSKPIHQEVARTVAASRKAEGKPMTEEEVEKLAIQLRDIPAPPVRG